MSCANECGIVAVELLSGIPGIQGPVGPQGPQGAPGDVTSLSGDVVLSVGPSGVVATVTGLQTTPVSEVPPAGAQFLVYDGFRWIPTTFDAGTY